MLPSSKLLPMTIVGLATILSLKAYALATTAPTTASLRAGAEEALVAVSSTAASGVIAQAHAATVTKPVQQTTLLHLNAAPTSAEPGSAMPARSSPMSPQPLQLASAQPAPPSPRNGQTSDTLAVTPPPVVPVTTAPPVMAMTLDDLAALRDPQPVDRASELAQREATISAAEKRLNARVSELVTLQQRLQGLEAELKERDEANWTGLVKLYDGMKPRDAAAIFNSLDKPVLLEILDRMKPLKASPILAAMDAERARQITADLAAKRTASATVAPSVLAKTAPVSPTTTGTAAN